MTAPTLHVHADPSAASAFPGASEMARRCRAFDWAATPLGPVERWPQSLRTLAATVLGTGLPAIVLCGPELVQLYNDAFIPFLGAKHPAGLGVPTRLCWPEAWTFNGPIYARVRAGETVTLENQRFRLARRGPEAPLDEIDITISYAPVPDERGAIDAVFVTLVDTTAQVERDRLLRELALERGRLETVFRQAPSFLAVLRGADLVFELANDAYYQLVGHRDILGRPVFDALPEVRGQGFEEILARVLATGEPFVGREVPLLVRRTHDAPAEQRFVDLTYLPLVEADGRRSGIIAHGSDVTDHVLARREVERLLAESEQVTDELAVANAQLEEQQVELEISNEQLQDQAAELEAQADELQATAAQLEEATEAAEAERRRLSLVLERLPVGVVVVDAAGAVVTSNAALATVLGHPPHVAAGLREYDAYGGVHADGRPYAPEDYPVARALLRGEAVLRELTRYRRGDGRVVTLSISATPVHDARGAVAYVVAAVEDVDERETARAEAEQARAQAEAANLAKAQFLANMSHELRTPLNAIQGHVQLLELGLHGPLTDAQRGTLGRIDRAQRHLLSLINDILGYARLESGRVEYDVQPTRVADVVADVLPIVEPLLLAKRLTFETRLAEHEGAPPLVVWADREKLAQVLLNLLSNAVKFTPEGGRVAVALEAAADVAADGAADGDPELAFVHVHDSGIGIPADKLEAIFEPFVQVRSAYHPGEGGTGLGLPISRDLTRGMGGDLRVRSTEGAGSTFTVALRRVVDELRPDDARP